LLLPFARTAGLDRAAVKLNRMAYDCQPQTALPIYSENAA
jgi:hypothetical protein